MMMLPVPSCLMTDAGAGFCLVQASSSRTRTSSSPTTSPVSQSAGGRADRDVMSGVGLT